VKQKQSESESERYIKNGTENENPKQNERKEKSRKRYKRGLTKILPAQKHSEHIFAVLLDLLVVASS
jgi:hypothetical protein